VTSTTRFAKSSGGYKARRPLLAAAPASPEAAAARVWLRRSPAAAWLCGCHMRRHGEACTRIQSQAADPPSFVKALNKPRRSALMLSMRCAVLRTLSVARADQSEVWEWQGVREGMDLPVISTTLPATSKVL